MKLSRDDVWFLRLLREREVLDDVNEHLLDESRGAVMMCCADGRRMYDIFTHKAKMQRFHRRHPKIHTISLAGGALRLVKNSPTNEPGHTTDIDLLREIRLGCELMDTKVVTLYAHGACGMARMSGMDLIHVFDNLVAAKNRVKHEVLGSEVACFYHVAYPLEELRRKRFWFQSWVPSVLRTPLFGTGERQRTYFLSRERYVDLRQHLTGILMDRVETEPIVLAA